MPEEESIETETKEHLGFKCDIMALLSGFAGLGAGLVFGGLIGVRSSAAVF